MSLHQPTVAKGNIQRSSSQCSQGNDKFKENDNDLNIVSYKTSYKLMKYYIEGNMSILDEIVQNLNENHDIIYDYFQICSSIPNSLPTKREKHVFKKLKGPQEIAEMDPQFSEIWLDLSKNILSDICIKDLSYDIRDGIAERIIAVKNYYRMNNDYIFKECHDMRLKYKEATIDCKKSKKSLNDLTKQIEEANRKIIELKDNPESTLSAISNAEKNKADLIADFPLTQQDEYNTIEILNQKKLELGDVIDEAIQIFEKADYTLFDNIHAILNFHLPLVQHFQKRTDFSNKLRQSIDKMKETTDSDDFYKDNNIIQLNPNCVAFNPPKLSFNMFEFLSPDRIFGKQVERFGATVVVKFTAKKNKEIDLEPGEIVTVKRKCMMGKVKVIKEDGHEGYAKSTCLQPIPSMKRKLLMITEDYSDKDGVFTLKENEVVMKIQVDEANGFIYCQNSLYQKAFIPGSITKELKP